MPFQEGNTQGPGRPKGAGNKSTERIRSWISAFLEKNIVKFEEDINSLEPKDRVNAISGLMEYAVPKLARVENVGDDGGAIQITIVRNEGNTTQPQETSSSPGADTQGS